LPVSQEIVEKLKICHPILRLLRSVVSLMSTTQRKFTDLQSVGCKAEN